MDIDKLKSCIVYACHKAAAQLDGIKLNKVLWYSDAASYMEGGESITSARYIRKPRGPVASYMQAAIRQLAGDMVITPGHRFDPDRGMWLDEYVVNEEAISKQLSDTQKKYLDHAIKRVCKDHTSDSICERTHGEIWEIAAEGEEIPMFTMFAERLAPITKENISAFD